MNSSLKVSVGGGLLFVLAVLGIQGCQKSQQAVYDKTRGSVLYMLEPVNKRGGGTGFVVRTESGAAYTMTNAHVCKMSDKNYVTVTDGTRAPQNLAILAISEDTDLCILPAFPGVAPLKLAKAMELYEHVNIVGHPLLLPVAISSGYVNLRKPIQLMGTPNPETGACENYSGRGAVAYPALFSDAEDIFAILRGCSKDVDANWSDAKAYPGNSGSPVVNDRGDVVGVLFAGNSEFFSFFVPLDKVKAFLKGY